MRLSIKILIIMAILVMGYAMLGYSTLQAVIVPGFDRLERKEALENLQRVERALSGELDYLVATNTDWSEWTDTYRFVLGEYEEYVEANLSYDTLVNIGLNVMAFYDLGGRVLWIGAYDLENGADLDVREFLPDGTASRTPYLAHTDKDGEVSGLLVTSVGPMLVVSKPILMNKGEGPAAGYLVVAKLLTERVLARMADRIKVDFELTVLAEVPDLAAAKGPVQAGEDGYTIESLSRTLLAVKKPLTDLTGRPALLLSAETPRAISKVGRETARIGFFVLIFAGALLMLVVWYLLRIFIHKPVGNLSRRVRQIAMTLDPGGVQHQLEDDEIGGLGRDFDDMLERLAVAHAELKKAKDDAEIASRTKSQFLANMSHELRTPLNAVIGFSEIIAAETFGAVGNEKYRTYAGDIYASGQHLLDLINDILDLSKIESGADRLQEEKLDFADIVDAALSMVRGRAEKEGVRLEADLPSEMPWLLADEKKIKQILANLLSNAVKFTEAGGEVRLEASAGRREGWLICVSDTGIGMAPGDIATAMTQFGQIDSALGRKYDGTGLGLPLSKALVTQHGGELKVESTPRQGTVVTVRLPPHRIVSRETAAA
jgi:signal transduction histidine kinase